MTSAAQYDRGRAHYTVDAEQQAKEKQGVMQVAAQHDRCSVHYRYKRGTTKAELCDSGKQHDKGKAL